MQLNNKVLKHLVGQDFLIKLVDLLRNNVNPLYYQQYSSSFYTIYRQGEKNMEGALISLCDLIICMVKGHLTRGIQNQK